MNCRELILSATRTLQQAGCDAPRLDAELLLMHVWQVSRTDLIVRSQDEPAAEIQQRFESLVDRRANREPLAHILGEKEFWSRPFQITPDVLVPRPETEHLIEAVLEHTPERSRPCCFCDIGTGSGCIAVTLALEYPQAQIIATDLSTAALAVAKANAKRHQVADRIQFLQGDMLTMLSSDTHFDAIISNPPYVSQKEMAELEAELGFEPRMALTDEADGLRYLSQILTDGRHLLKKDGMIVVETGPCGLPDTPEGLLLEKQIVDLAAHLRGGHYRRV